MDKIEEDWNGCVVVVFEIFQPNSSAKFIFVVCNISYNAWETLCLTQSCDLSFTGNFPSFIANKDA